MAINKKIWLSCIVVATVCMPGCASSQKSSFWSGGWFGSKENTPPAGPSFASQEKSPYGASARLGSPQPAASSSWLSNLSPFKKSSTPVAMPSDDALNLDKRPTHINPQLYVHMARLYEIKGDHAAAIEQYKLAQGLDPRNIEICLSLARAYDRKGDAASAIATYESAVKLAPENAALLNDVGLFYARRKEIAKAESYLAKAVAVAPQSELYRNNLATTLVEQKRYDEALTQLVAVFPPATAHYNLGYLAHRQGDNAYAIQMFEQATRLDPSLAPAHQMMAKLQNFQQALPTQETVIARTEGALNHTTQQANAAYQNAEAQLRNALQSQGANLAPRYASPVTPVETSRDSSWQESGSYSAEANQELNNRPVLLPPIDSE
jgi:Tfp pilus assembly protein PilF